MANLDRDHASYEMGMHTEQLAGRTQQVFFLPEEKENFTYPGAFDVDFNKRTEIDVADMDTKSINLKIRELMSQGYGTIVVKNPGAKHSIGVGILNRLQLYFEGSLGYFGVGLIDGPNVRISGRVGWSCAENMMAGTAWKQASELQSFFEYGDVPVPFELVADLVANADLLKVECLMQVDRMVVR